MEDAAIHATGASSVLLTERERRGLEFSERHPWLPFALIAVIWLLVIGTTFYKCEVLLSHGASFGFATWSDLWSFGVGGWREAQEPFSRFHLFVLETIDESAYQVVGALVLSMFLYGCHLQNRMIHKLRRALDDRRDPEARSRTRHCS